MACFESDSGKRLRGLQCSFGIGIDAIGDNLTVFLIRGFSTPIESYLFEDRFKATGCLNSRYNLSNLVDLLIFELPFYPFEGGGKAIDR